MKDISSLFKTTHMSQQKNLLERIKYKFKYCTFDLFHALLKQVDKNIFVEIVSIVFQLLQLLGFPLSPLFENVWKSSNLFTQLSSIFRYFQVVYFFENAKEIYLIAFYFCVILILAMIIDVFYVAIVANSNKIRFMWPISFLRMVLSLATSAFFLPISYLLLSIFSCKDGVNIINKEIKCWKGVFYMHAAFSILFTIIFVVMSYIVQSLYFDTKYTVQNPVAKSSSRVDIMLLCVKFILVVAFCFLQNHNSSSNQWVLSILLLLISIVLVYNFYEYQPFYNKMTIKLYTCLFVIFSWTNVVLFIALVFHGTSFDGAVGLFFIGIPILLCVIFVSANTLTEDILHGVNRAGKGEKALLGVNIFANLVETKETSRESKIILSGFIQEVEEHCPLKDCALKKYFKSLKENNIDAVIFLLQHCELMYQNAIEKFPFCPQIRISYAFFELEKLNKKQSALMELSNCEKYNPSFEQEFIIYRYKKILEEQTTELNENEENLDLVTNIEYKSHFAHFKAAILKVTMLYVEFWSLLQNTDNTQENLGKLNEFGTKIGTLTEEIKMRFEKMQKLKHNDKEGLKYYADFLYDILNDREKAREIRKRLSDVEVTKTSIDDSNIMNVDLTALSADNEFQYIAVSAQSKSFGIINNVSLGICSMFGFTKNELIGKSMDILIPEIFLKEHQIIMQDAVNEFKKNSLDMMDIKKFKAIYKEIITFGRNKSRYLIPIVLKVTLIPTENGDNVFIGKLMQNTNQGTNGNGNPTCQVITNNALVIQNFTPNAMNLLGMSSGVMNSSVDITEFIKQFNEEFLKYIVENEDRSIEQKLLLKQSILNKKFRNNVLINWKRADFLDSKHNKLNDGDDNNAGMNNRLYNKLSAMNGGLSDEQFLLNVKDIFLKKKKLGYIFTFEKYNKDAITQLSSSVAPPMIEGKKNSNIGVTDKGDNLINNVQKDSSLINANSNLINNNPNEDSKSGHGINVLNVPIIEQTYIPDTNFKFHLDPKTLSYKTNLGAKNDNLDIQGYLKDEALKKIQIKENEENKTDKDSSSEVEESEDVSESKNSKSSNSFFSNESKEESSNNSENKNTKKVDKPTGNDITKICRQDEYYLVNFSKIKFSKYDYRKNQVFEVVDWPRMDEIKFRMSNDIKKKEQQEKEDAEKEAESKEGSQANESNDKAAQGEFSNKNSSKIYQIEYALEKDETQPTITKMKWISFLIFVLFVGSAVGLLLMIVYSLKTLKENIILIEYSYKLLLYNSYSVFYIRELTLLNNENYTDIPTPLAEYTVTCFDNALNVFELSHDYMTYILTSFLDTSDDNYYKMNNETIYTNIIKDDFNITRYDLTMTSAIVEANTALYQVSHYELSEIIPTNKDVFYFIYNSLNDVAGAFTKQASIFIDELSRNVKQDKIWFIVVLSAILIVLVVIYFLMAHAYDGVAKKKEDYLAIFYTIGNGVIKDSLERCEKFSQKIQTESVSGEVSSEDNDDVSEQSRFFGDQGNAKDSGHKKKLVNTASRDTKIFRVKLVLLLLAIGLFSILVFVFYVQYMDKIKIFMQFYKNTIELETEYINLFNGLREYMFDPQNSISSKKANEYLNETLENIYIIRQEKQLYITDNVKTIPGNFFDIYDSIYTKSSCLYKGDYFKTKEECEEFMEISNDFGIGVLMSTFIETIRRMKNKAFEQEKVRYTEGGKYKYNMTLTSTSLEESYWPSRYYDNGTKLSDEEYKKIEDDYIKYHPIQNFIVDGLHLRLTIMFLQLVWPVNDVMIRELTQCIDNSIDSTRLLYICIISALLGIIVFSYTVIYIPFEINLNQTIYKTKNMLAIIPKKVLADLPGIDELLGMNMNHQNNKKK